ncbi:MAG: ABC transporter substrate-binding protein [Deinococcota bacterium]
MKKLWILACLLVFGVAFAQTPVTFWTSISNDAMTSLVDDFNTAHPDTNVEVLDVGNYNEMITRMQAAVVSGRVPDVVMLEITRYGIFADRGVLEPLDTYIEADTVFDATDLIPGIREATLYQGTPFVIPFNNSVPVMYYNRDILREAGYDAPPATWDELLAYAQELTIRDDAGNVTQYGVTAPPQWVRHAFVRQNGGDWMTEDQSELILNQAEAVEAYQFLYDLIYTYNVANPEASIDATDRELARPAFTSGRSAIYFGSTGSLGGLREAATFDLAVAPLPCNVDCAVPIGGATLGIVASAPQAQKEAAWTFISWMTQTENNAFWHTATGYMPIRLSTLEQQTSQAFYEENPNFKVAIDQFQAVAFPRPRPPAMPAIRELELTTWEEIATQAKTVEEALNNLAQEANLLLQSN